MKAYNQGGVVGLFYFTPREHVETIISNWCSNLHLNCCKYIWVKYKLNSGFYFSMESSCNTPNPSPLSDQGYRVLSYKSGHFKNINNYPFQMFTFTTQFN